MFAFKILNLKKCSSFLIAILSTLCLGLICRIISTPYPSFIYSTALPPAISGWLFSFLWLLSYATCGYVLYGTYSKKPLGYRPSILIYSSSIAFSMAWQIVLFRYRLYLFSALLILSAFFLCLLLIRKTFLKSASVSFWLILQAALMLYSLYFSVGCTILN